MPLFLKHQLDQLYSRYHSRSWVHPDPLEVLYHYTRTRDREIVALIASSLAYGRVAQILKSVSLVLKEMGDSPFLFLQTSSPDHISNLFQHFRHRFTSGQDLSGMLIAVKNVVEKHGDLYSCFLSGYDPSHETILPAITSLTDEIRSNMIHHRNSLLPMPARGSACKRLNLFMRWMVRKDRVDPGGWPGVNASKLIIPLDTHMHRISLLLDLTRGKQATMKTALEITRSFRKIAPEDPVRYDFALTRLGIRREESVHSFVERCGGIRTEE
jgi:uncharacterized protein (TIGR02757 family)